jgi:NAD(P)-dependent dehydrogenase (short-subunit alcohol dehydrogenase family)
LYELAAHGAANIFACYPLTTSNSVSDNLVREVTRLYPNTQVVPYPLDTSSENDTLALIDNVLEACGRLDVWVCSSGLLGPPSIEDTGPSDLQKCWEANALAPFLALKYARRAMEKTCEKKSYPNSAPKDASYGSIIVVGSTASTYGGNRTHYHNKLANDTGCWGPCYTMSSHAALGVVRSGVVVLKGSGIRINAISPGQIDVGIDLRKFDMRGMSDQLPPARLQSEEMRKANIGLERAGLPVEVARVAGFLASGFSAYITGANMIVDGGAS